MLSESTRDALTFALSNGIVKELSNPRNYKPIEIESVNHTCAPRELRADSFGRILCIFECLPEDRKKHVAVDLLYIAARIGYQFSIPDQHFIAIW